MRERISRVILLVSFLLVVGAPAAFATSVPGQDLTGFVVQPSGDCPEADPITITRGHLLIRWAVFTDQAGNEHYRSLSVMEFTGVGASGTGYSSIFRVHQNYVDSSDAQGLFATNWVSRQRIISHGSLADQYLDFNAHSTITPDGDVVVSTWSLEIGCR